MGLIPRSILLRLTSDKRTTAEPPEPDPAAREIALTETIERDNDETFGREHGLKL